MSEGFTPKGELRCKKYIPFVYYGVAGAFLLFMLIMKLVRENFENSFIIMAVVLGAVFVYLGIDSEKNRVQYNDEKIRLLRFIGKPVEYDLSSLTAVYEGEETLRLEFEDKKKLYISMKYEGYSEFESFIDDKIPNKQTIL